jgi:hypothetical protein
MTDGVKILDGKMGRVWMRMWFPLLVFSIFMVLLVGKDELYSRFLANFSGVGKVIFEYGSQIGVWLSGAFLAQRFFTVFVWDGVIAGISGRPVPRLPKDFYGHALFWYCWNGCGWERFLINQLLEFGRHPGFLVSFSASLYGM